ncbi:sulfotransferase [Chitinophagales bacterium]|nr:sulfotransferase [Chitinophagales bacterium]
MNTLKLLTEKLPESIRQFFKNEIKSSKISKYIAKDITKLYTEVHENAEVIFILSPGRSGTKYLTKVLEYNKELVLEHKGTPELGHFGQFAFENQDDLDKLKLVIDASRYEQIRDAYLQGKIYIETNNKITFFSKALLELYPKAKFISLQRDPIKFVESGYSRDWYLNRNIRDEGRIEASDKDQWNSLSQVEKIAFQWKATHEFIQDFFSEIDASKYLAVKSTDLFKNQEMQVKVLKFILGQDAPIKRITQRKTNAQEKRKILTTEQIATITSFLAKP